MSLMVWKVLEVTHFSSATTRSNQKGKSTRKIPPQLLQHTSIFTMLGCRLKVPSSGQKQAACLHLRTTTFAPAATSYNLFRATQLLSVHNSLNVSALRRSFASPKGVVRPQDI